MTQIFRIHPETPQKRLVKQAVDCIRSGGVVVYPTDAAYAIGCALENKRGLERIIRIRELDDKHEFTILCRDLSELATYAKVENWAFRLLKAHTPGPYTFILRATNEVPRRLMHPKKKTLGLRVPENAVVLALLEELGEPLMSTTLKFPGDEYPLIDPEEIYERVGSRVDLVLDGGWGEMETSTVVDLEGEAPVILRLGKGDSAPFQ
ncbi:threonylcarbamoyl-AMP synthase [Ketobacter sp. MCCC 1A13808]|uniref:L-threonylcarbamoyladenylate synthase n=1 Tax=Ketobacter sp. MCCC 1A13808 TaxID=2602738 RepID=UPI000F23B774|nr:L-threonylcarbamoyladenylate synthase [Ketobacter sp. MCCC 1A13808]MVF12876.1 threonylcarbamoyl-AMP synthase [Ketobacter sp. MCCC 1A13808]RLP54450.1 MAG: threonylcarbamoyl-AMP synthase [Ketobacter sp.]